MSQNKLGYMGKDPRFYSSRNSPDDVFLWCEGAWCYRSELDEMGHMSDDYLVLRVDSSAWIRFFEDIENDHREQEEILDANYAI